MFLCHIKSLVLYRIPIVHACTLLAHLLIHHSCDAFNAWLNMYYVIMILCIMCISITYHHTPYAIILTPLHLYARCWRPRRPSLPSYTSIACLCIVISTINALLLATIIYHRSITPISACPSSSCHSYGAHICVIAYLQSSSLLSSPHRIIIYLSQFNGIICVACPLYSSSLSMTYIYISRDMIQYIGRIIRSQYSASLFRPSNQLYVIPILIAR